MTDDAASWRTALRNAATEEKVIALVREYAAGIPAEMIGQLPPGCRPGPMTDRDEIISLNLQLVREELLLPGDDELRALFRGLILVFTEASARLAQIELDRHLGRKNREPDGPA